MSFEYPAFQAKRQFIYEILLGTYKGFGLGSLGYTREELVSKLTERLTDAYSAGGRVYHNVNHLYSGLNFIYQASGVQSSSMLVRLPPRKAVGLAFLGFAFHDFIQNAGKRPISLGDSDEYQSAHACYQTLSAHFLSFLDASLVSQAIRRAAAVEVDAQTEPVACLIHDADYAILSAPPEMYKRYREDIAKEYICNTGVARASYIEGRIKFLNNAIENLTYSRFCPLNVTTEIARKNMREEIIFLEWKRASGLPLWSKRPVVDPVEQSRSEYAKVALRGNY